MRRHGRMVTGLAVGALLLASCGGQDASPTRSGDTIPPLDLTEDTSTATGTATTQPTTASTSLATPDIDEATIVSVDETAAPGEVRALVRTLAVDQTAYYAGFVITVDEVHIGFDLAGFAVAEIRTTLTNNTESDGKLDTAVEVESSGFTGVIDRLLGASDVPAGQTGTAGFSIRLDQRTFTFGDAVLHIGRPDRQRVSIPLGSTGDLITREPTILTDVGAAGDDLQDIEITSARFGWDIAQPRMQAEPDAAFVTIDWTLARSASTSLSGGDVELDLPDGTTAVAVQSSAPVLTVDAGVAAEVSAAFAIVDPMTGDYVFRYTERFGNGVVEVPFSFDGG